MRPKPTWPTSVLLILTMVVVVWEVWCEVGLQKVGGRLTVV